VGGRRVGRSESADNRVILRVRFAGLPTGAGRGSEIAGPVLPRLPDAIQVAAAQQSPNYAKIDGQFCVRDCYVIAGQKGLSVDSLPTS
jgi:hypothetical protein